MQEKRLRELLGAEERATRASVFQLDTQTHPLVNPYEGLDDGDAFPCYRACLAHGGRAAPPGTVSLSASTAAPTVPATAAPMTTVPTLFPAHLRPQFTQLEALDLLAIERRADLTAGANAAEAALQARVARARQHAGAALAPRQARAQKQAERCARAAGLQATKRMQEDYVTMGTLGRP